MIQTSFSHRFINLADIFAFAAHSAIDQRRKYTNEPYINHPRAVAKLVEEVPDSHFIDVAIALLHDVVEDTKVTADQIESIFGAAIRNGVAWLTNVELDAGNRAKRFQLNLERLADAPPNIKTIKIADLIDNTSTIALYDPKFAPVYLREKRELLDRALRDCSAPELWSRAWRQCEELLVQLEKKP